MVVIVYQIFTKLKIINLNFKGLIVNCVCLKWVLMTTVYINQI